MNSLKKQTLIMVTFSNFLIFPILLLFLKMLPFLSLTNYLSTHFEEEAEFLKGGDYTDF
jgi:hypothetical protein